MLEIGPGTGNLTSYMPRKNQKNDYIEKDNVLATNLENKFNNQLRLLMMMF